MRVLAVDIGWHNMGLVLAETPLKGPDVKVEFYKKVSLADYKDLGESNDVVHLVPLFVDDHHFIFQSADVILIERQPPSGLTAIQTLLHYILSKEHRKRVIIISPNSLHVHFGISHLTYEQRKERTEAILARHVNLDDIPGDRKHDIADAMCMILYYNFENGVHFFDRFKFKL
jgi:hypothetical protein